jgi:dCTP diphosphatase
MNPCLLGNTLAGNHFYIDLVFYHTYLKCRRYDEKVSALPRQLPRRTPAENARQTWLFSHLPPQSHHFQARARYPLSLDGNIRSTSPPPRRGRDRVRVNAANRDQSLLTANHPAYRITFPHCGAILVATRTVSKHGPRHTAATMTEQAPRLIDTAALERALEEFAKARDWEQFHSPKNLAMALTGEVGELVELFQWLTEAQSRDAIKDPALAQRLQEEMADVMLYLVRMASVLGVDMDAAVRDKLAKNALKYPAQ